MPNRRVVAPSAPEQACLKGLPSSAGWSTCAVMGRSMFCAPAEGGASVTDSLSALRDVQWEEAIVGPATQSEDPDNARMRRKPELSEHEDVMSEPRKPTPSRLGPHASRCNIDSDDRRQRPTR